MSLPKIFNKHLQNGFGYRAVWSPGRAFVLGDVMVKKDGMFHEGGHISDFTDKMREKAEPPKQFSMKSSGTKERIFQAGVELPDTAIIDIAAEASIHYEFASKSQFVLKTPELTGSSIDNMLILARELAAHPDWKHRNYHVVSEIYGAEQWSFIGNEDKASTFKLSGSGSGILSFLNVGASIGLSKTGKADLELLGKGGMLAMKTVRIDKDGSLNHGD